jgi:hypothetical protein
LPRSSSSPADLRRLLAQFKGVAEWLDEEYLAIADQVLKPRQTSSATRTQPPWLQLAETFCKLVRAV